MEVEDEDEEDDEEEEEEVEERPVETAGGLFGRTMEGITGGDGTGVFNVESPLSLESSF